MEGGAAGTTAGDDNALRFGEPMIVGGDMDSADLCRGECGGGGNFPEERRLGIMLLWLPLLLVLILMLSLPLGEGFVSIISSCCAAAAASPSNTTEDVWSNSALATGACGRSPSASIFC